VHELDALGEVAREDPKPGTDLQDDIVRPELSETPDDAENVLVDEEVLTERLLGNDGHDRPNAIAAFS